MRIRNWGWILLCFFSTLQAELQQVVVSWNPLICRGACPSLLTGKLQAMGGLSGMQINAPAGLAQLNWSPNASLNLPAIYVAFRSIGLQLENVHVRVKGKIVKNQQNFFLVSTGDHSLFQLIGPTLLQPGQYRVNRNISTHPLPVAIQQQLSDAQAKQLSVSIEGSLFEPDRYALILIVEQIKVSN
jgi:hypothetical protein